MANAPPTVRHGALFKSCRVALHYSPRQIAKVLFVASERTIRRWEANKLSIPDRVWEPLVYALAEQGFDKLIKRILVEVDAAR